MAAIKRFEDILHIESSDVNVNRGENEPGQPKPGPDELGAEAKQVELYFTINGEVDTEADIDTCMETGIDTNTETETEGE